MLIARWPCGCPSSASLLLVETIAGDVETQTSSELLATLTAANTLAMIVEDVGWAITSFKELFANQDIRRWNGWACQGRGRQRAIAPVRAG